MCGLPLIQFMVFMKLKRMEHQSVDTSVFLSRWNNESTWCRDLGGREEEGVKFWQKSDMLGDVQRVRRFNRGV